MAAAGAGWWRASLVGLILASVLACGSNAEEVEEQRSLEDWIGEGARRLETLENADHDWAATVRSLHVDGETVLVGGGEPGFDGGGAVIWVGPDDGDGFERARIPGGWDSVAELTSFDDGYVAVAERRYDQDDVAELTLFHSADGRRWETVQSPVDRPWAAHSVDGTLYVGGRDLEERAVVATAESIDDWSYDGPIGGPGVVRGFCHDELSGDGGTVFAVGTRFQGPCDAPGAWAETDGEWATLDVESRDGSGLFNCSVRDGTALAVGTQDGDDDGRALALVGTAEDPWTEPGRLGSLAAFILDAVVATDEQWLLGGPIRNTADSGVGTSADGESWMLDQDLLAVLRADDVLVSLRSMEVVGEQLVMAGALDGHPTLWVVAVP